MTAATTTTKMGLDGKAYVSTTTHSAGTAITWSEFDLIEQITHEDSKTEAEIRNRSSTFAKFGGGKRGISYTLTATYDATDAVIELLLAAYDAGTIIALAVMDGAIALTGQKGFFMDVEVFSAPRPEDLEEFDKIEIKVRPSAKATFEPVRVEIAAPSA